MPDQIVVGNYIFKTALSILGQPPRKSNKRRLVGINLGKPRFIRSQEALDYENSFILQARSQYLGTPLGSLKESLRLDAIVWYQSRRSDLSVELVMDCLEAAGVVANDRFIIEQHLYGFVDKNNPRVWLALYQIDGVREIKGV